MVDGGRSKVPSFSMVCFFFTSGWFLLCFLTLSLVFSFLASFLQGMPSSFSVWYLTLLSIVFNGFPHHLQVFLSVYNLSHGS